MSTDDDKNKTAKLLQGLEVPEIKLSERCSELVKNFHEKFDQEIEEEEKQIEIEELPSENPYRPPKDLLQENDTKLRELLAMNKRSKKQASEINIITAEVDPKRPWRTNSNKERLLRINNELKCHLEKSAQSVTPLEENVIQELVRECEEEGLAAPLVPVDKLIDVVDSAKKGLPNFQYRKIDNTTATAILPTAHETEKKNASGCLPVVTSP